MIASLSEAAQLTEQPLGVTQDLPRQLWIHCLGAVRIGLRQAMGAGDDRRLLEGEPLLRDELFVEEARWRQFRPKIDYNINFIVVFQ